MLVLLHTCSAFIKAEVGGLGIYEAISAVDGEGE